MTDEEFLTDLVEGPKPRKAKPKTTPPPATTEKTTDDSETSDNNEGTRRKLDYRAFELHVEDDGRLVLTEIATPQTERSGSVPLIKALKAQIEGGDETYNGKTLVVAGLSEQIKVKVEMKRVVSFD